MNPLDELARVLPRPPASHELPNQQRHKTELLTIIAADQQRRRALLGRASRGWLGPVMAATAVAAVAVLTVAVPTLVGAGSGNTPASQGVRSGGSSRPTAAPSAGTQGALPTGPLTRSRRWSVGVARFERITVGASRGSVTVVSGSASSALLTATPHYAGQAPVLVSQVRDGTLGVIARCPREVDCQVALTLKVPAGVAVRATSDLGNVRVTGLHGTVTVTARQGDIFLTDLSGRVSASNELGDVTLTGLSGPVTATTGEGTIDGTDLTGPQAALSSQDGDVSAVFAVVPTRVTASSQLGDVVLRLPSAGAYDVIVTTQLGRSSITVPRSVSSSNVIRASSQLGSVTVTG